MMYDCICVGSATVDAFASTKTELVKIITPHIKEVLIAYPAGTKLLIKQLEFTVGGGGTNTAVAMSRLGLKTAFIGKIGMRNNSQWVMDTLKHEKVDTSLICRGNSRTGYSVILDAKGDDRTILTFKGSNNDLGFKEINKSKLKTKWFYFASMMEKSFETLKQLAKFAEKNHIKIAFNPSSYLAKRGQRYIREIMVRTDILILNKEEAQLLVGNEKNKQKLLLKLMALGPKQVVVTDGKKGAFTMQGEWMYEVQAQHVKVVEATGAGDAFASTFVAATLRKAKIELALQMATVNAQSVLQHYGAKNNLMTWPKIRRKLLKNKPKITRIKKEG